MKYYYAMVYYNKNLEKMTINARSKAEAFFILDRVYRKKLESNEVAIVIRDLTHEEKKMYFIDS